MSGNDFHGEQELNELARLLPVPAARDLSAGRQQVLKEHLMTELHRADPTERPAAADKRRKRSFSLAAVAGAAVLAAAVAATVIVTGHSSGSSPQANGTGVT